MMIPGWTAAVYSGGGIDIDQMQRVSSLFGVVFSGLSASCFLYPSTDVYSERTR